MLVSRNAGNTFADGAMIENGVPDATGWDLAFKISKEDGTNAAPVLDNPIGNITLDAELPFNLVVPANTFSDPDANDTITYRAQLAGGGSLDWLTFNEATKTFAGTPHWHQAGTMTVELIATDNHGASTSNFFDIEVINTNTAPTVANPIPDQITNEDAPFSFQFDANTFADVDVGNTFTYSAELAVLGGMPPWLSFDAATRTFSGTPANGDVGTWTVEVTANDGFGGEMIDTFVITVAKQHEPHDVVVADNLSLPHPNGVFDFAISIAVIHHLSTPARRVEAVKCVLDLLRPSSPSNQGGGAGLESGRALIYVWALEQKDSRRGWDEGHEQDVMVPWVLKQKKEKEKGRRKKKDESQADEEEAPKPMGTRRF